MTAKKTEERINFVTDTTDLAAYLVALGSQVPVLDKSNPKNIKYIFELTGEQYEAIPEYHNGQGMVPALAMANARKKLMWMVHNQK